MPYVVSVGHENVHRAVVRLVDGNPRSGTLRVVTRLLDATPEAERPELAYSDVIARGLDNEPAGPTRACAVSGQSVDPVRDFIEAIAGQRSLRAGQELDARVCFSPPSVLDAVIGEREALIAVPDRRGRPRLRSCIVIDDPDFVEALRTWFDDFVWEPPGDFVDVRDDEQPDVTLERVRERLAAS